jgi:type IV pilus assembly protein PilP
MKWPLALVEFMGVCAISGCRLTSGQEPASLAVKPAIQATFTVDASPMRPQFQAQAYAPQADPDPFNDQRLALAHQKEWQQLARKGGLLGAELHRKKESLEAFPLESISMVGHMSAEGRPLALVKVDAFLYAVRLGSHLGQNFGRVISITDRGLRLRELVQDPTGKWTERPATLALQERVK